MTADPGDYRWSSHARNAGGIHESRISSHPAYLQLGADDASRQEAYSGLFATGDEPSETNALRLHTQQQKAWGSERFRQQIEALTQRAAGVRPRGRPKSPDK